MDKKKIFVALLLIPVCSLFSQSHLSLKWLNNSTGANWELVNDMKTDKHNNIYVVGNCKDTSTIKSGINSPAYNDVFIASYDQAGETRWIHSIRTDTYYHVVNLIIDSADNCFISGYTFPEDTKDIMSVKLKTLFIDKVDNTGKLSRFSQINGKFNSLPFQMVDNNGAGLLIGGSYREIVVSDSTYSSLGNSDIFILRSCDKKGKHDGMILLQGYGNNELNDIVVDNKNNIYITGCFEKELHVGNTTMKSKGRSDSYLVKLNSNLEVIYAKQFGGHYKDYGSSLTIDSLNNVIVSGSFSGEFVSENGDTIRSNGKLDVFTGKFDESGNLKWMESFGGYGNEYLTSSHLNDQNNLYLCGSFRGEISHGTKSISSAGFSSDAFITKYNSEGILMFIESIGDTNTDFARSIVTDSLNFIYLAGNFNNGSTVLGDSTRMAKNEDYFVAKLYDCDFSPVIALPNDTSICDNQFVIVADSGFTKYLWNEMPDDFEHQVDSTGSYYLKAYDEHGCLSTDTIFIRLNKPLQVDLGDDITMNQNETIVISAGEGFDSYLWNNSETDSYLEIDSRYYTPGKYNIGIKTEDKNGCITKDQLILEIIEDAVESAAQFEVFPNPTNNRITLRYNNIDTESTLSFRLVNETGSVVLHNSLYPGLSSNTEIISIDNLEPGVYYLKVTGNDVSETFKIVKL